MSKLKISAKAEVLLSKNLRRGNRGFRRSGGSTFAVATATAEVEVPLLRKLQNLSQCDREGTIRRHPSRSESCSPWSAERMPYKGIAYQPRSAFRSGATFLKKCIRWFALDAICCCIADLKSLPPPSGQQPDQF